MRFNNNLHLIQQECNHCHKVLPIQSFELVRGKSYRLKCEECRADIKKAQRLAKTPQTIQKPQMAQTSQEAQAKDKIPTIQEKPTRPPMKPVSHPEEMPDLLKHIYSVMQNLLRRVDLIEQSINKDA
jgi:hypothetical protein